mmetsp:Transcript_18999/g.43787  ORF Transcript_18999/g.43787 Transcript_18999/m.43787 type:complete len:213 (+) Transcript_18999:153-791(+)
MPPLRPLAEREAVQTTVKREVRRPHPPGLRVGPGHGVEKLQHRPNPQPPTHSVVQAWVLLVPVLCSVETADPVLVPWAGVHPRGDAELGRCLAERARQPHVERGRSLGVGDERRPRDHQAVPLDSVLLLACVCGAQDGHEPPHAVPQEEAREGGEGLGAGEDVVNHPVDILHVAIKVSNVHSLSIAPPVALQVHEHDGEALVVEVLGHVEVA